MGKIDEALGASSAAHGYYKLFNEKREQTDKLIGECKFTAGKNSVSFKAVDGVLTVYVGNLIMDRGEAIELAKALLDTLGGGE